MNDVDELARLRARVAELEAERTATFQARPRRSRFRSFSAAALIVVACLLAPFSAASVWASTVLSDTDRYVETVAPVADDPGVQAAVSAEVTSSIMENLDIRGLTTEALDALAQQDNMPPRVAGALPALAAPLAQGVEGFIRNQVGDLVASPQFAAVWAQANRVAHAQVVKLLQGDQSGALTAQGDTITLNLGPVVAEVKARLADRGFALADRIPVIDKEFVLVRSEGLTRAQRFYAVLNSLGAWLPVIALTLFAAGVLLARDRRRALLRGALGITGSMLALGLALALFRSLYVESTPGDVLTSATAANVFDILVRFLRTSLRATAVLGLLVALAALLSGSSTAAVRTRTGISRGIASLRESAESAGWRTGSTGSWVYAHKTGLRVATFVAAGLALAFWNSPTAGVVLVLAVLVGLVLALVEFIGRPPGPAAAVPAPEIPQQPSGKESTDAVVKSGSSRPPT